MKKSDIRHAVTTSKHTNSMFPLDLSNSYDVITGIDMCASLPCHNGGHCKHSSTYGYICDCVDDWKGRNCAYKFDNNTSGVKVGLTTTLQVFSL